MPGVTAVDAAWTIDAKPRDAYILYSTVHSVDIDADADADSSQSLELVNSPSTKRLDVRCHVHVAAARWTVKI